MPTIKVSDIAYVRVRVPDLDRAERFMTDFGLVRAHRTNDVLYMRGSGPSHHIHVTERGEAKFLSLAFYVDTESELRAAAGIPGASAVETIAGPGGGKRVRLQDPDGNGVEIVWGLQTVAPIEHLRHPLNDAKVGLRRAGTLSRHTRGPSKVLRIGHGVIMSMSPAKAVDWYREHLGLLCSDEVIMPDGSLGLSFNRVDRGEAYVDHHVLLIQGGPKQGLNHAAFEVQDVDDLMLGHEHMMGKDYDRVWGVGRHVYGAQIFDYWMDPWGFMYEHWTDTDRLNSKFVGLRDAEVESANGPWGEQVPDRFFTHAHE
ncbi:MAG: catechol 1,2-dioxygenase [Rhodospirillaceae bacterium]|nr:MAG: catechol 1,2-dioxygenase [Rhodospirillaceae bacterium]